MGKFVQTSNLKLKSMKTTIASLILLIVSVCANAQKSQEAETANTGASIAWESSTVYDLGNVTKGTSVTSTFEFTNNGSEPVILSDAKGSCGCTSIEYIQQPVSPGAKGYVKATFSANSVGSFYKSVTVSANISSKAVVLYIKGQVVE